MTNTLFLLFFLISVPSYADKEEEKRADILKMESETLQYLYSKEHNAKKNVQNAAGYAVFSNFGWELSGQGTAAAKLNEDGAAYSGAISVSRGVWLYQITEDGLAIELTGKGAKYYKDGDLN